MSTSKALDKTQSRVGGAAAGGPATRRNEIGSLVMIGEKLHGHTSRQDR
jgi:hypothetical protein